MIKSEFVANLVEKSLRNITDELAEEQRAQSKAQAGSIFKKIGVKSSYEAHIDAQRTADYWRFDGRMQMLLRIANKS